MEHTGLSWTPKWTCWLNFKIEQNHLTIATEKINFFLKHDCPRLNILQQFERDFDIDHLVIKLTETTWQAVRAVLIPFVLGVSRDRLSQVSAVGPSSCPDIADSLPHYSGTFLCVDPESCSSSSQLRQQGSGRGRYTPYGYGSCNNNYASRGFNTTRCYNCRKTGHRIADCPALKRA